MRFKTFGNLIKELREKKNLTQGELATELLVSRQAISNWEQGKRLPEEKNIEYICKFFDISADDIMNAINADVKSLLPDLYTKLYNPNESHNEEKDSNEKEDSSDIIVNNITNNVLLNIYNERIKYTNKFRKGIIILISIIVALLLLLISYIMVSLYTAVNIYTISGESKSFTIRDGLLVTTRDKIYFNLGEVINNTNQSIRGIKLYYKDKNNVEKLVYEYESDNESIPSTIVFYDQVGYNAYIDVSEMEHIIGSLTIDFTFEDDTYETVTIHINKQKYSKVFPKKQLPESEKNSQPNNEIALSKENEALLKVIENKFYKQGDGYRYDIKDKKKQIEYVYMNNILIINVLKKDIMEIWEYDLYGNYLAYQNYEDEKFLFQEDIDINNIKENQKEYYDNFENLIEKIKK